MASWTTARRMVAFAGADAGVLFLQRSAGNAAVVAMLKPVQRHQGVDTPGEKPKPASRDLGSVPAHMNDQQRGRITGSMSPSPARSEQVRGAEGLQWPTGGFPLAPATVPSLQRTVGNAAVTALLLAGQRGQTPQRLPSATARHPGSPANVETARVMNPRGVIDEQDPERISDSAMSTPELQRPAGNAAVIRVLFGGGSQVLPYAPHTLPPHVIQRCGTTPCDCPGEGNSEKREHRADGGTDFPDAGSYIQRVSLRESNGDVRSATVELTHVVEQHGGKRIVQREPKKEPAPAPQKEEPAHAPKKIDISIVLTDEEQDLDEARTYADTVLRATDKEDAARQIKSLRAPLGAVHVLSHSNSIGQVEITSSIGTIHFVSIADLGKALKGAATIDTVEFHGCNVGKSPSAMESFRTTVGARSTKGVNCFSFTRLVTPLVHNGKDVTTKDQIPKQRQGAFDEALRKQIAGLVTADNKSVVNCLSGLARGEEAGPKTLDKIWRLYWDNHGVLVARWVSPEFNEEWQKDSICYKDLTASTTPCSLVEVTGPAAGAERAGWRGLGRLTRVLDSIRRMRPR